LILRVALCALALVALSCNRQSEPHTITGLITEVRSDSAGDPEFIKLRDRNDQTWELPIQFDPGAEVTAIHLEEHRAQRLPVKLRLRESENGPYVAEIADVPSAN
jgi:hypothetical protein